MRPTSLALLVTRIPTGRSLRGSVTVVPRLQKKVHDQPLTLSIFPTNLSVRKIDKESFHDFG